MALNIKTRDQFVQDEVAAVEAALPGTFLFPVGSIVRALVDAHSATAMWEQALIQFVYNRERLATSTGSDADSFVADFGLTRLPAVAATGNVQFASFVANTNRTINVGSTVSTQDRSVSFAVTEDTSNSFWNASVNAYVIPAGQGTVASPATLPVEATTAGAIGNVKANTITVINSPITGIDIVNNADPFINGKDIQTDAQLRQYFIDYLNSLSRATKGAISFAVESVKDVAEYSLVENKNYDTDAEQLGYFYVVVDDGTGTPPQSLIDSVTNAVEVYRGLTIRFDVKAPIIVNAAIVATITMPTAYNTPTYIAAIQDAVSNALEIYIDLIPFGETLFYTRIPQIIYNTLYTLFPTIIDQINVSGITLNGGTDNLTSTPKQSIRATAPVININCSS
jgi:phage-related baseplate assembly protein